MNAPYSRTPPQSCRPPSESSYGDNSSPHTGTCRGSIFFSSWKVGRTRRLIRLDGIHLHIPVRGPLPQKISVIDHIIPDKPPADQSEYDSRHGKAPGKEKFPIPSLLPAHQRGSREKEHAAQGKAIGVVIRQTADGNSRSQQHAVLPGPSLVPMSVSRHTRSRPWKTGPGRRCSHKKTEITAPGSRHTSETNRSLASVTNSLFEMRSTKKAVAVPKSTFAILAAISRVLKLSVKNMVILTKTAMNM